MYMFMLATTCVLARSVCAIECVFPISIIGPGFIDAPVSPHIKSNKIISKEVFGIELIETLLNKEYFGLDRYFAR